MLHVFQYVEVNCFALVILLLIFLNMRHPDRQYLTDQMLFLSMVVINAMLLLLDTAMWLFDGRPGIRIRFLYVTVTVLYNVLNPVLCAAWYFYVNYYVYGSREHFREGLKPIALSVVINLVLSVTSIFTNIYFVLDADNVYRRGRFIPVLLGICLYMIAYTMAFLIRNRKRLQRKELFCMLFFAIPPSIGGIVQALHYGSVLLWACATLSILIIFINLQNNQLVTDYLTGLYNRRYLDFCLESMLKSKAGERWVAGLMIDLNSFKQINDLHGHSSGDRALRDTAMLLKRTFRKKAVIARYGGDEFVVVLELQSPRQLSALANRLRENVVLWNLRKTEPYSISLSIGYDTVAKGSTMDAPDFLAHIDHLMYLDKQTQICRTREETTCKTKPASRSSCSIWTEP